MPAKKTNKLRRYKLVIKSLDWWRSCPDRFCPLVLEGIIAEAERVVSYVYRKFNVLPYSITPHPSDALHITYMTKLGQTRTFAIHGSEFSLMAMGPPDYKRPCSKVGSEGVFDLIDSVHYKLGLVDRGSV